MTYKEENIKHENGAFFVLETAPRRYEVFKSGITHAVGVSFCSWRDLSLAVAYCDYKARAGQGRA